MSIHRFAALVVLCAFSAVSSFGQAPSKVSFQGYLTDDVGAPRTGTYDMTFKLYKGGGYVWTEYQSVTVTDGYFNVTLGAIEPLNDIPFDQPIQLGIALAKDPEMVPRITLASAAYALALPALYTFYREIPLDAAGYNVIGGSPDNVVGDDAVASTIGGGGTSGGPNEVDKPGSTVGGGIDNAALGRNSTVSGGEDNNAPSSNSTVGGGKQNSASNDYATVAGGEANTASGGHAAVGGGSSNLASGGSSMIPGGLLNEATGAASFAAGRRAKANHAGAFVWGDNTNADFASTANNQFLIRAGGGVGIGTNSPGSPLTVNGRIESTLNGFKFPDGTVQTTAAGASKFWALGGNPGTTPGTDYIGTSDGTALQIRANDGVTIRHSNLANPTTLHVAGPIHSDNVDMSGLSLIMYKNTTPNMFINPDGDGFHVYTNENYFATNEDALIFLKTDGNTATPDGGIAFANVGSTGALSTAMSIRGNGSVGIGTVTPGNNRLKVMNSAGSGTSTATVWAENTSTSNGIAGHFKTTGTDATLVITNDGSGDLLRAFSSGGDLEFAVRNNGNVNADGTYTSPATDLAEVFDVEGPISDYEPGDVLVISVESDRTVTKSDRPYSMRVAGVYATKPGVQLGTPDEGTVPMGVVGVIPTKVSSENGPIARGDLLVTSSTPGHAMKAEPVVVNGVEIYPSGTILGKALEPFEGRGTGVIEVLVNVQ